MKSYSSLCLILILLSCNQGKLLKNVSSNTNLKTVNKSLIQNFDQCLRITELLIQQKVTALEFRNYFTFDLRATGFEYENEVRHISDTLTKLPNGYQIFYDFIYNGDTISAFRVDFDSSLNITYYRYHHLNAFRKFINKNLLITGRIANEIAIQNGVKANNLESIFRCSKDYPDTIDNKYVQYFWESTSDCNECPYLTIDAKTGQILERGKVVHQY